MTASLCPEQSSHPGDGPPSNPAYPIVGKHPFWCAEWINIPRVYYILRIFLSPLKVYNLRHSFSFFVLCRGTFSPLGTGSSAGEGGGMSSTIKKREGDLFLGYNTSLSRFSCRKITLSQS